MNHVCDLEGAVDDMLIRYPITMARLAGRDFLAAVSPGTRVRPTKEAIREAAFGKIGTASNWRPDDPGVGIVLSEPASMPGCVTVDFSGRKRMVHIYWIEPENRN